MTLATFCKLLISSFTLYSNIFRNLIYSDDVLQHGNETEILVVKKLLSDRLEELNSAKIQRNAKENDVVYFEAERETFLKPIQMLGNVNISSAHALHSRIVGRLTRVPRGKKSSFNVITRYVSKVFTHVL